jgi:hypothetical protein
MEFKMEKEKFLNGYKAYLYSLNVSVKEFSLEFLVASR